MVEVGGAQAGSLVEEVGRSARKLLFGSLPVVELLPVFRVSDVRAGGDGSHSSFSSTSSSAARHKARGAVVGAVAVRHALARGGVETLTLGAAPFAGRSPVATLPVLGTVAGVAVAGARWQRPARVWVAERVRR